MCKEFLSVSTNVLKHNLMPARYFMFRYKSSRTTRRCSNTVSLQRQQQVESDGSRPENICIFDCVINLPLSWSSALREWPSHAIHGGFEVRTRDSLAKPVGLNLRHLYSHWAHESNIYFRATTTISSAISINSPNSGWKAILRILKSKPTLYLSEKFKVL